MRSLCWLLGMDCAPCDIRQLPLLPDVADALSAYLLDGRPASTNRTVFLRHCAPFERKRQRNPSVHPPELVVDCKGGRTTRAGDKQWTAAESCRGRTVG